MINFLKRLTDWIFKGGSITRGEAFRLFEISAQRDVVTLLSFANVIRENFKGPHFEIRSNVGIKTGDCHDYCGVCLGGRRYDIDANKNDAVLAEILQKQIEAASASGADNISLVFCGMTLEDDSALKRVSMILTKSSPDIGVEPYASFGVLDTEAAEIYKSWSSRHEDNINVKNKLFSSDDINNAAAFYEIIDSVKGAKDRGYKTYSGAVIGAGESAEERILIAYALKELNVDSIVLNFQSSGGKHEPLTPLEMLKNIAIYRFINPDKDLVVEGMNWKNLKMVKPLVALSGANSLLTGNLFSGSKNNALEKIKSLEDLLPVI